VDIPPEQEAVFRRKTVKRIQKFVFAALIGVAIAGGVSTPTMAMPPDDCEVEDCDPPPPPPPALQEDVYKKGSFDITLTGDPSQWG
jgi:hypothetical protein